MAALRTSKGYSREVFPNASAHCCRIQLGELLTSALPVPQALPITKSSLPLNHKPPPSLPAPPPGPRMPSSTGTHPGHSATGSPRAVATGPEPVPSSSDATALGQGQVPGLLPVGCPSAPNQAGPSGRAVPSGMKLEVPEEEAAYGDRRLPVDKAKQVLAAAARGVDAADYSTLQAVSAVASGACSGRAGREGVWRRSGGGGFGWWWGVCYSSVVPCCMQCALLMAGFLSMQALHSRHLNSPLPPFPAAPLCLLISSAIVTPLRRRLRKADTSLSR